MHQKWIAKLENLGAFQLFFTLSCADMRWEENFAAILRDQGLNIHYSVTPDKHGHSATKIEVEFHKDGQTFCLLYPKSFCWNGVPMFSDFR